MSDFIRPVDVIAAHRYDEGPVQDCDCGWLAADGTWTNIATAHAAHVLEALAAHRMTVATLPEADKVTNFSVRLCLANGWGVGTRLAGDEGYGETVIEITYMSERTLLAKRISNDGVATFPHETSWSLDCREWHEVTADAAEAVSE